MEEYTPKLERVDNSINEFKSAIENQKNLINQFFEALRIESNDLHDNVLNLLKRTSTIKRSSRIIFFISILLLSFFCGTFISFQYSEKYYFSDHRLQKIKDLEAESLRILNKYYADLNLIDELQSMGCVINKDMLLAPASKVKHTGDSEDKKFKGVWLK
ncbi:MAG: hypothetical protein KKG99_17425 [Bacteroidetes bacterium]|nr:hypothetical protein [Bacteroidota bacterium]